MRLITLATALVLASPADLSAQHTCKTADAVSSEAIRILKIMMGPDQAAARTKFGLPLVDPSQITLATNSTLCGQAGTALDSLATAWTGTTPAASTAPLYVFQIGTTFAVVDPGDLGRSDHDYVWFFGASWNYKGVLSILL